MLVLATAKRDPDWHDYRLSPGSFEPQRFIARDIAAAAWTFDMRDGHPIAGPFVGEERMDLAWTDAERRLKELER